MTNDEFEERMRAHEEMGKVRVPAGYIVLRLDGKGFSKFTERHFIKPFDPRMSTLMENLTMRLMKEFDAVYGYTESDEISLLLPLNFSLYERQLGKLLSISSAIAASMFTLEMSKSFAMHNELNFIAFDSRVWHAETKEEVLDYFRWRASDAVRCGLNTWTYWTLRKKGYSAVKATRLTDGRGPAFKIDLLKQLGVDFASVPAWQKRGIGFYRELVMKDGLNPKTGETVKVPRRRVKTDHDLPEGSAYADYVNSIIERAENPWKDLARYTIDQMGPFLRGEENEFSLTRSARSTEVV